MSRKHKRKSVERNRQKRKQQKNQKRNARKKEARKHGNHRSRKMLEIKGAQKMMQALQEKHDAAVNEANELVAASRDEVVEVLKNAQTADGRNCFEVVQEMEAARNEKVEVFNKRIEAVREEAMALQKVMAMESPAPDATTAAAKAGDVGEKASKAEAAEDAAEEALEEAGEALEEALEKVAEAKEALEDAEDCENEECEEEDCEVEDCGEQESAEDLREDTSDMVKEKTKSKK